MLWLLAFLLFPVQAFAERPADFAANRPLLYRTTYTLALEGRFQEALDLVDAYFWPTDVVYGESQAVARSIIAGIQKNPQEALAHAVEMYHDRNFQKTLDCTRKWLEYCARSSPDPCNRQALIDSGWTTCDEPLFGSSGGYLQTLRGSKFAEALAYYHRGDLIAAEVNIDISRKLPQSDFRPHLLTVMIYKAQGKAFGAPTVTEAFTRIQRTMSTDEEKYYFDLWAKFFLSLRPGAQPQVAMPPPPPQAEDDVSRLVRQYVQDTANAAKKEKDAREKLIKDYVTNTSEKAAEAQRETEELIKESVEATAGAAAEVAADKPTPSSSIAFYAFLFPAAVLLLLAGVIIVQRFRGRPVPFPQAGNPAVAATRYPNLSYRIAAFFWLAFWITLATPPLILAWWILRDFRAFSWDGLQAGFTDAATLFNAIMRDWAGLWVFVLPALLLGFIAFKLYGRYSLPKAERPRILPLYATARVFFFALSLATMYYSLDRLSRITDQIVETGLIQFPEDTQQGNEQVRQTILTAVASSTLRQDFNVVIQAALDREDVAHAEIYVNLANWQGIPIAPELRARYDAATGLWQTTKRHATDCVVGGLLRNADTLTQILCLIGVDLAAPAYADWADIARQVIANPIMGTDTDPLIVALATLGIILRQFDSTDDSLALRSGSSFVKVTSLSGRAVKASPKLTGQFRHLVTDAFDYEGAVKAFAGSKVVGLFGVQTRVNPRQFIRPRSWDILTEHFNHLYTVTKTGGPSATVASLRYADDLDQLRFTSRIANKFDKNTAGLLHLLKSRAFGVFKQYRIAKAMQLAFGGWAALYALALTMLLSSLFSLVRSRVIRIVTLRFLRRLDERRIASQGQGTAPHAA